MKFFEITFILLLMIPIALLMRYFVTRLSAESPKQQRSAHHNDNDKPSIKAWLRKKNQQIDAYDEEPDGQPYSRRPDRADRPRTEQPAAAASDFVPRKHTELKRTERIPFSEIYGEATPEQREQMSAAERVEQRRKSEAARKRVVRSEQAPSKRQKRKNRERARKREINRRKKSGSGNDQS